MYIDILPSISTHDLGQSLLGRAVVYLDENNEEQTSFIIDWHYSTYISSDNILHYFIKQTSYEKELTVDLECGLSINPQLLFFYVNDLSDNLVTLEHVIEELRRDKFIERRPGIWRGNKNVDLFLRGCGKEK